MLRWLVALAVLVVLPAASAVPLELEATAAGPVRITGSLNAHAAAAAIAADTHSGLSLTGTALRVVVLEARTGSTETEPPGPLPGVEAENPPLERTLEDFTYTGSIQLSAIPNGTTALFPASGTLAVSLLATTLEGRPNHLLFSPNPGFSPSFEGHSSRIDATALRLSGTLNATLPEQAMTVLFHGGTATLGARRIEATTTYTDAGDPFGTVGQHGQVHRYLAIQGVLVAAPLSGDGWRIYAESLEADLSGTVQLHGVKNPSGPALAYVNPDAALLEATGAFRLRSDATAQGSTWSMTGEAVKLAADGVAVISASSLVVATGTVAGAAALLLVAVRFLPNLLAGLNRAEPLANPLRRAMLQHLALGPQTAKDLALHLGLSRQLAMFHLGILRRGHHVRHFAVRGLRYYALAGASADPQAYLAHPVRRAIYATIPEGSGIEGDRVRAKLQERGLEVSQQLFSFHARALVDAGLLVGRRRKGRTSLYYRPSGPSAMPQNLPAEASA
ncbi:MAG: hypothetical protein QOD77_1662 [Thermoplasmata archaeon]|jgi:DNA-binding transcriptional ArsR family regulator|nr:hypothetical protein [Thermoplasmata archaeon]